MKIIRSPKHPGLRVAAGKRDPGILLLKVHAELAEWLQEGDRILAVDGHVVEDILDFHYYSAFNPVPELKVRAAAGEERTVRITGEMLEGERLEFESLVFKTCGNDCVFCFIHQMPDGLREDLYFMDEDYRLGFLYGNYVTMALIREHELKRIIDQHLSPVYLSVHSTDMALRNRLLGLKRSRDIHEIIRRLLAGGISIHSQIVLLPGWNDGDALSSSLTNLAAYHPGMESVGIVPVGLTKHRQGLTSLRSYDASGYGSIIDQVEGFQSRFQEKLGTRFVYLADECYLAAGRELPQMEDYESFFLYDNGIGMSRDFIDVVRREIGEWREPSPPLRVGVLTGKLGEKIFQTYLREALDGLPGLELSVLALENRLFGYGITVSGLLAGRELLAGLSRLPASIDLLLLPANCLNADELFLDDLSLEEFRREAGLPVIVPESGLLGPLRDFALSRP